MTVALGIAIVHVLIARRMEAPIIHPDEYGYLTNARWLAGQGTSSLFSYHPGYSAILVPLILLVSGPLRTYQAALVANALLNGLTLVLVYRLIRALGGELSHNLALVMAAVLCVYPAVFLNANVAWSENLLIPAFLATVLLFRRAMVTQSRSNMALLGLAAGGLFVIHPRASSLTASVLVAALWGLRPWSTRRHALPVLVAAVLISVCASLAVATAAADRGSQSALGVGAEVVGRARLGSLVSSLSGQSLYLLVATGGLVIIGVHASIRAWRTPVTDKTAVEDSLAVLIGLSLVAMMVVAAAFIGRGTRADHLLYGRYAEAALLPVLALGLVSATRRLPRPARLIPYPALLAPAVVALVLVGIKGANTLRLPIVRANSTGIDGWLRLTNFRINLLGLAALAVVGAFALDFALRKSASVGLALLLVIFAFNTATAQLWMWRGSTARSRERVLVHAIGEVNTRFPGAVDCVGLDVRTPSQFHEFNYRYFLPDTRFEPYSGAPGEKPCSDFLISAHSNVQGEQPGALVVETERGIPLSLWVLRTELQAELAKQRPLNEHPQPHGG